MKISKILLLSSLCALVFSGCASRKYIVALPESVQKQISSTDVYLDECDKKVRADIESSNISTYVGGGLLIALVDCAIMAHRESSAENALEDVQKVAATFNFQEKFSNRLSHSLQNTNWLHVQRINHVAGLKYEEYQEIFKKANTDCVLVSKFFYKLNPQFNVMTGTLFLTLYPTSQKLKNLVKTEDPSETPIFNFHISATEALPQAGHEMEENAKLWAQNNGSHLRSALENILNQIFVRLDKILQNPNHLPGE